MKLVCRRERIPDPPDCRERFDEILLNSDYLYNRPIQEKVLHGVTGTYTRQSKSLVASTCSRLEGKITKVRWTLLLTRGYGGRRRAGR